jgi:type IV secretion system protein VirB10
VTTDPQAALDERARRLAGAAGGGGRGRILLGGALALAFAGAAVVIVAPAEVGRFFRVAASETETMQRASRNDPGVSTEITRPEPAPDIVVPSARDFPEVAALQPVEVAPATPEPATAAERDEELLAVLRALAERPEGGALDAETLREVLDEQAARLREEHDRQLELQRQLHEERLTAARMEAATVNAGFASQPVEDLEARERREEERARLAAIRADQIQSDSLVFDESRPRRAVREEGSAGGGDVRQLTADEAFLAASASDQVETAYAARLENPSRTIVQGSVLEATLETAIDTDMPGIIRAVLNEDARGYDGSRVLLPRGSRLIGTYSSDVSVAQRRALVAWTRAITPGGESVMLGGSNGADALGRSGQAGDVDSRFRERFGSAALISLIGAAPVAVAAGGGAERGVGAELADDVAGDFRGSARSSLSDYLRIKPTIRVDQGTRMTVLVNRDLVF